VIIESTIVAIRRSSFDVEHRLFNGGELAVEGFETRVWAARDPAAADRIRPQPIPAMFASAWRRIEARLRSAIAEPPPPILMSTPGR
jgi:4-hydroxybenzoyl-CoA thioesterase